MEILNIHNEIFDYLYKLYEEDRLCFMPRKNNAYNKLEEGYLFLGNDKEVQLNFWDANNKLKKKKSINYIVRSKGSGFLEFNPEDGGENEERSKLLEALVDYLVKEFDLDIKKTRGTSYKLEFASEDYMENLAEFLDYKYLIDESIKELGGEKLLPSFTREDSSKYINRIIELHRK